MNTPPNYNGNSGNYNYNYNNQPQAPDNVFNSGPSGKSRGVAALLAILLGTLGVQYFYVGKVTGGLLAILITAVTCGAVQILWIIQGIMMFCMSQQEFENKFVYSRSVMPVF